MTHYEGSVCYSHPEVPRLMADKIRAALVENPTLRLFSVSIPDSGIVQCECPECAARIARVGAGVQVELANRVADELAPDYPDIRITVLAYGVDPSAAVKVHPNVVVFYAPIAARWNRIKMLVPLGEDPAVVPQLAAWQKTAERLFFWDYIDLIEPPQPYPNLDPFAEGLRFLASQGVRGYFADCTTAGGSLAPLKKWVFTKLTWNPSLDLDALIAEFLSAYYGDAASAMAAYTEVQRGAWRRYIAGFRAGDPPSGFDFTPEELDRMRRALADAAARAEENPSLGSSHK